VNAGFLPDSISTDLHVSSMNAGMKSQLEVMGKFLAMGLPLDDVVARATWNPARQIKLEDLGHLSVGAQADVAVIEVERGAFGFMDQLGLRVDGTERLVCQATIRDGAVVYDLNGLASDRFDPEAPLPPR
jgi:dihydroorotase